MYQKHNKGFHIFTNFGIKFGKKQDVQYLDKEFFNNYSQSGLELLNSVVAIDECHVFFDSRNSQLKRNKIFSKFITQSRKRSVDLIYTTQDKSPEYFLLSGQVELRLRKLTDYIIFCECEKTPYGLVVINHICDKNGVLLSNDIFMGNKYFSLYDTNEIIDMDLD